MRYLVICILLVIAVTLFRLIRSTKQDYMPEIEDVGEKD